MNVIIPEEHITSESFVVKWDVVTDFFTVDYTIRWYGEDSINETANVNGLSYTVTGLTNNTSYNVTVHANNTCCGAGPDSNVIMNMTNMEPPTSPPTLSSTLTPTPNAGPSGNVIFYICIWHN